MATRKRHRRRKGVTRTVTTVSASPRRRRRHALMTTSPRRKRRRGMSDMNLVKGKYAKYANPILEGVLGGYAGAVGVKLIPQKVFDDNPSIKPYENWLKGLGMAGLAVLAVNLKQPLVGAGIMGFAVAKFNEAEGILQEDGMSARSFRRTRFADPALLAAGRPQSYLNPYPDYVPLYDEALLADAYDDISLRI